MKLLSLSAIAVLLSILTIAQERQTVPFDDKRWVFEAQSHLLEGYQGKNSLYLQNGKAWLRDEKFRNGIIEYDVWLFKRTSFSGVIFRLADPKNYEELYLRSQQSGFPDAFQYTPVFNGDAGWQLYHDQFDGVNDGFVSWKPRGELNGYNAVVQYPFDRWLHVKILIRGTEAELYLDNNVEPTAFIRELKRGEQAGSIGVEANVGNVYFSNFTYSKTDEIVFKSKPASVTPVLVPGTVVSWRVSNAFRENDIKNKNQFDALWLNSFTWSSLKTEKGDFINLSRLSAVSDSTNTFLVKLVVNADKEQINRLDLGYSDRIKAYCNGNVLYSGNAAYRSRDFRHLGTMGYFDAIYLPLRKGENTIILAVSETFGGWGLMGKFENMEGIRIMEQ